MWRVPRATAAVLLAVLAVLACCDAQAAQWELGTEHVYNYESLASSHAETMVLKHGHEFPLTTRAKFRVASLGMEGDNHHLRLFVDWVEYYRPEHGVLVSHQDTRDFSNWFSFLHGPSGAITHVRFPSDEPVSIVNIKKGMASILSAHQKQDDAYDVDNDLDHAGPHAASYKTRRMADGAREIEKTLVMLNTTKPRASMTKRLTLNNENLLTHVSMAERLLAAPGPSEEDLSRIVRSSPSERPQRHHTTTESETMQDAYTQTHTRSLITDHIVIDRTELPTRSMRRSLGHEDDIDMVDRDAHDMDDVAWSAKGDTTVAHGGAHQSSTTAVDMPADLVTDSIEQQPEPRDAGESWDEVYSRILDSLDCIEVAENQGSARRGACVMALLKDVSHSSEENIAWLGSVYLDPTAIPSRRAGMLDALVEFGSPAAQAAIMSEVFDFDKAAMGDILRALTGLVTMKSEPTTAMLDYVETIVFRPFNLSLRMQTQAIREQAMLTLGAMIRGLQSRNPARATVLTGNFVDMLYNSGPEYSPRARRSAVEKEADHRIPVLYALGNAAHPAALPHVIAHLRGDTEEDLYNTRSHRIRHTAATALGDFEGREAESALLDAAFQDPNIAVRRRAIRAFRAVPRAMSEHSVPLPTVVPDSPANMLLEQHREDQRRRVARGEADPLPVHTPDLPPSAFDLWQQEMHREASERPGCLPDLSDGAWRALPPTVRVEYTNKSTELWIEHLSQGRLHRRNAQQPVRRALFGLELNIKLALPGVGWSLPLGGRKIGAEFGLSFSASATLYFSLLKSRFSVDANGNAYGRLYVGFMKDLIGIDELAIFTATAAFKGYIGFELSIISDFDLDDIVRLFNKVQQAGTDLMNRLWGAINTFLDAVGITGDCGAVCLFNKLLGAIEKLPDLVTSMFGVVTQLADYVGPNATQVVASDQLRRVMQAAYSIVATAYSDINRMYTLVFDTVKVTIPGIANNVTGTAKLIIEAIQSIVDCPVAATYALIVAKDNIQANIAKLIFLKGQFEEAFFISTGQLPTWLNPTKEVFNILLEFGQYFFNHTKILNWQCNSTTPRNPTACFVNRTVYDQEVAVKPLLDRLGVIGEILDFVQTTILPPINAVTDLYANIVSAWEIMKMVYDKARAIFDFLFGVKFHKTFPRQTRDDSTSCGTGIYPSLDHKGAISSSIQAVWGAGMDMTPILSDQCDLACQKNPQRQYAKDSYEKKAAGTTSTSSVKKDKYITVPFKGRLTMLNRDPTNLILRSSSFSVRKYEFLIGHVLLIPEAKSAIESAGVLGWEVQPGWQIALPNSITPCEDFIRVSVRLRDNITETEDPKSYVAKAPIGLPQWVSEADQWIIKLLGFTIKQGTFGAFFNKEKDGAGREKMGAKATPPKARRDVEEALALVEPDPSLFRVRRDVCSEFADAPDLCMAAGLPVFSKYVMFFKWDFSMLIGGFIPITLGFKIGGEFGMSILLNFCLLTLKVTVTPVPAAVAQFDVYAAVGTCFFICGGLKISGKVADLKFPLPITLGFKDKPISVTVALNMELIPLTIIFTGFVEIGSSTVFSMDFFKFAMDPIKKNIFTLTTKSKDSSPPKFDIPTAVYQDPGHDATNPGIMLSFKCSDPETKVNTAAWFVGSTRSGSDLGPETKLDPSIAATFQPLKLPSQTVAYVTVKCCNTDEFCSTSSALLPSWDLDGPIIDPVQAFDFQSHPSQIEARFSMFDQTQVVNNSLWWAFGTTAITADKANDTSVGSDIWPWVQVTVPPPVAEPIAVRMNNVPVSINLDFTLTHNTLYFLNVRSENWLGLWNAQASKGVLIDLIPPFPSPLVDFDRCQQSWFDFYDSPDVKQNLIPQGKYVQKVLGCENQADEVVAEACVIAHAIDWMGPKLSARCVGTPTYLPNHRILRDSGTLFNGDVTGIQTLYQGQRTFLGINWNPFTDLETGIYMYAFSAGREPCGTEVLTWRDPFFTQRDSSTWSYSGAVSGIPALPDGLYYLSVRAYNNAQRGGPLATTVCNTVPLAIDTTKPVYHGFETAYDDNLSALIGTYNFTDDLSDLMMVQFGLGYTPTDQGLVPFADYHNRSMLSLPGTALPQGVYMYGRLRVFNNVKMSTTRAAEEPLFLDFSPPMAGQVWDGMALGKQTSFSYIDTSLACNWANFFDLQSGVGAYEIGFSKGILDGTGNWVYDALNPNNTIAWEKTSAQTLRVRLDTLAPLLHNTVYFATVIVYHRGHRRMFNSSFSPGILIDKTCPTFPSSSTPTTYMSNVFQANDPLARCLCPLPSGFSFVPGDMGNLCFRQANATTAFIRDGTPADATTSPLGAVLDLKYSANPNTVQAYWAGFSDPESDIASYNVAVGEAFFISGLLYVSPASFSPFTPLTTLTPSFRDSTYLFRDGTTVVTSVQAVNKAGLGTIVSTDGFLIDTSPPVLVFVNDGPSGPTTSAPPVGFGAELYGKGVDTRYRTDRLALDMHCAFYDLDSGIDFLEIAIFRDNGGTDLRIFPVNGEWFNTNNQTNTSTISIKVASPVMNAASATQTQARFLYIRVVASALSEEVILVGSNYYFKVRAWNRAGIQSAAQTNGVLVDDSPPTVGPIRLGVLSDEAENDNIETETGLVPVVVTFDEFAIKAFWSAVDPQSGISSYYVAIGIVNTANPLVPYANATVPDRFTGNGDFVLNCSVCNWTYMSALLPDALPRGDPLAGFVPMNLATSNIFDLTPNGFFSGKGPVRYVVTVAAMNGAGSVRYRSSKPFRLAASDVAGTVLDGPDPDKDVAVQDGDTITATFYGWQTECGGIMGYEWAIGSMPGGTDIQPFTPEGIVMAGDHGTAQMSLSGLNHNESYFSTVRAVTMCRIQSQQLFDVGDGPQGPTAQLAQSLTAGTRGAQFVESVSSGVVMDRTPPVVLQSLSLVGTKQPDTTKYALMQPNATHQLPITGDNATVHVLVRSEDGQVTDYLFNIYQGPPSPVATLQSLKIVKPNTLSLLNFTVDQTAYNTTVPYDVSFVTVRAQPTFGAASMLVGLQNMVLYPLAAGAESDSLPLAVGWTTIAVKVFAQDKMTVLMYTISVLRAAPSAVCTIDGVSFAWLSSSRYFGASAGLGQLQVPFRTSSMQVTLNSSATLSQAYATITNPLSSFNYPVVSNRLSGMLPLRGGAVNLTLVAWSQDESRSCSYTVTVLRTMADTDMSLLPLAVATASGERVRAPVVLAQASSNNSFTFLIQTDTSATSIVVNITTNSTLAAVVVGSLRSLIAYAGVVVLPASADALLPTFDVVAESGVRTTYYINVSRRASSTDVRLSTLGLDALMPDMSVVRGLANVTLPAAGAALHYGGIPFQLSQVRFRLAFANIAARCSVQLVDPTTGTSTLKLLGPDTTFVLSLPPVYATTPYIYVQNATLVMRVLAEDGLTDSNYTVVLSYNLPNTTAQLANISMAYVYGSGTTTVPFTANITANTTRYPCVVPFSATTVALSARAAAFGSVQASLAGRSLSALSAAGLINFNFSATVSQLQINVQAKAQDGLSTNLYFVDVTRAAASNSTAVTARVYLLNGTEVAVATDGQLNFSCTVPYQTAQLRIVLAAPVPYTKLSFGAADPALGPLSIVYTLPPPSTLFALPPIVGSVVSESGLLASLKIAVSVLAGNTNASLKEIVLRSPQNDTSVRYNASQLTSGGLSTQMAFSVTRVYITVTPTIARSTVSVSLGPVTMALAPGVSTALELTAGVASTLLVTSTSESGTVTVTATIQLTRRAANTNALLQGLSFGQFAPMPAFSPNITIYSMAVFGVPTLPVTPLLPAGVLYSSIAVGMAEMDTSAFISDATSLKIQWTIDDLESGLQNLTNLTVGTVPWGMDLLTRTFDTPRGVLAFVDLALPANISRVLAGLPIGATVDATNTLNVSMEDTSSMVTLDTTPPNVANATVMCPRFTDSVTEITCAWYGYEDLESPISHYLFSVGLFPGDASLFTSTFIGWTHHFTAAVSLQHGMAFYVTVTAINSVGLSAQVSSSIVSVDLTPPVAQGRVWELDEFLSVDWVTGSQSLIAYLHTNTSDFAFNTAYTLGAVVRYTGRLYRATSIFDSKNLDPRMDTAHWTYLEDSQCQKDRSRLHIMWDAFEDTDSGIDHYEIAVGTSVGGGDVSKGWISVPANTTQMVVVDDSMGNDIVLFSGQFVYVAVKAVNGVNMSANVVSNGVGIAAPAITGNVYDGKVVGVDAAFQNTPNSAAANWATNDPCPVVSVETRIVRADDFVVQDWTVVWNYPTASPDTLLAPTSVVLDIPTYMDGPLPRNELQNGRKYLVLVRLTNFMQQQALLTTNGFVVQIEPPARGVVYDGPFVGQDINVQASLTTFSASWFDCLLCARQQQACPTCFGSPRADSGQAIQWYSVGMGSNPRFDATKSNIAAFVNVGLNTTTSINFTAPLSAGITYYIAVRGYTMPDVFTEAISNGIIGGFSVGLQAGNITAPAYLNALTSMAVTWTTFDSPLPLYQYEIAIVSGTDRTVFVMPYTRLVGLTTAFTFTNLSMLAHNRTYQVCVRATDQALMQNTSCSGVLLVDLTPPCTGVVRHNASANSPRLTVSYEAQSDQIAVSWTGFADPESGLDYFSAVVVAASTCNVLLARGLQTVNQTNVTACTIGPQLGNASMAAVAINGTGLEELGWAVVANGTSTSYQYRLTQGQTLNANQRYVVLVRAHNRAGLTTVAASPVLVLDESGPKKGDIVDGSSFFSDWQFQNSNNSIYATFTHAFAAAQLTCATSSTSYFTAPSALWPPVSRFCRAGVCNATLPSNINILGEGITYDPQRVSYDSSGLSLSLVHPREGVVYSGGVMTRLPSGLDGTYTVQLTASGENDAVNSIVFWGEDPLLLREPLLTVPADPREPSSMAYAPVVTYDDLGNEVENVFAADALGFQLRNMSRSGWQLIVWSSSRVQSPQFKIINLEFDPADGPHIYQITLDTKLSVGVRSQGDLYVDRQWIARFFAFPPIDGALFGFSLSTEDFSSTTVPVMHVSYAALPLHDLRLCRAGNPFFDETSAIVKYEWAVGTLRDPITQIRLNPDSLMYVDNIVPFRPIPPPVPCRPCLPERPCDQGECDPSCVSNSTVALTVANTSISLSSGDWFARCRWVRNGGQCLSVCPPNGTYVDTKDSVCKPCHEQCADGCLGPLPTNCRRCAVLKQEGVCVGSCDVGFYDNGNGLCLRCSAQCMLTPTIGCYGPTAADCDRCLTVAAFVDGVKSCVSACPPLNYAQGVFNVTLNPTTGLNESTKIEGRDFCVPCDASCGSSCIGPLASDCNDCKTVRNLTMTVDQWQAAGESPLTYDVLVLQNPPRSCVSSCPVNSYLDDQAVCRPCDASCTRGCLGPTTSDCIFCPRFTDSASRRCVDYCDEGQFAVPSGACYNCSQTLCGPMGPPLASVPASFFVNPFGALAINATLLRVTSATNLSFAGGANCLKVVTTASGRLEDANFVNYTTINSTVDTGLLLMTAPVQANDTITTKYRLRVTAQDGLSVSEYIVRAVRLPPSTSNALTQLSVSEPNQPVTLVPAFDPTIFIYDASISFSAAQLRVQCAANTFASIRAASSLAAQTAVTAGLLNVSLAAQPGSVTVSVTSESGLASTTPYTIRLTRRAAGQNALLSSLQLTAVAPDALTSVTFSPAFDPSVGVYSAVVPFRTANVTAAIQLGDVLWGVATVNGQLVASGATPPPLVFPAAAPSLVVVIVGQSESRATTKTYTLTLTRAPRSSNALLGGFTVTAPLGVLMDNKFSSSLFTYQAFALYSVRTFQLAAAMAADAGAVVSATVDGQAVVLGASLTGALLVLRVTAENGLNTTVTNITLASLPPSSDAALANAQFAFLGVSLGITCGGSGSFVSSELSCTGLLPATAVSLTMGAGLSSAFASMVLSVGGVPVNLGPALSGSPLAFANVTIAAPLNQATVTVAVNVTAENNDTSVYTFVFSRAALSSNANLSTLATTVGQITPDFDPTITTYTLTAALDDTVFALTATALYSAANVTVGFLSNVDNSSSTLSCQPTVVSPTQCSSGLCVQSTSIVVVQTGVFGFFGFTSSPRLVRNITTFLDATLQQSCVRTIFTSTYTRFTSTSALLSMTLSAALETVVGLGVRVVVRAEDGVTQYFVTVAVVRQPSSIASFSIAQATFLSATGASHDSTMVFDGNFTSVLTDRTAGVLYLDDTLQLTLAPTYVGTTFTAIFRPSTTNLTLVRVRNATLSQNLTFPLEFGSAPNRVVLVCTAPDGVTRRNFTILVYRPSPSSTSTLSSLQLSGPAGYELSPPYISAIKEYSIVVPYSIATFSLLAVASDVTATLLLGRDLSPDGVPPPISALPGELFQGYCVVSHGYGFTSVMGANGVNMTGLRTGTWSLAAMLVESGITLSGAGFVGDVGQPVPALRCAGSATNCGNCSGTLSSSGLCLATCPPRTYANTTTGSCMPCHASCAGDCVGAGPENCTLMCSNQSSVQPGGASVVFEIVCTKCLSVMFGNTCLLGSCPFGFFADAQAVCQPCHAECAAGCTGATADQCTRCANVFHSSSNSTSGEGYCAPLCNSTHYENGMRTCLLCNTQCASGCSGGGADQCSRPSIGAVNVSLYGCANFSFNGTCVLACPDRTYTLPTTLECLPCHVACGAYGCTGPTMRECKRTRTTSTEAIIPGTIQDSFFVPGTYFVTIRATDAANNVVYATSSGVTVDYTPPALVRALFHADPNYDPSNPEAVSFMANNASMIVGWDFEDLESSLSAYEYCVGQSNTTCDMVNWTNSGKDSSGTLINQVTLNVPMLHGRSYYARTRAYNRAGLNTTVSSTGVLIDLTPPMPGQMGFTDAPDEKLNGIWVFTDATTMAVNWTGFTDPESGMTGYDWSIGLAPGTAEVLPWSAVGVAGSTSARVKGQTLYTSANTVRADRPWESNNNTLTALNGASFRLEPGVVYYNNVRGWNNALLSASLSSAPFMIRRPYDKTLKSTNSGSFALLSIAFSRRAVLDLNRTAVAVNVPVGGVGTNTLLNLIPLSAADYSASYTFGTGRQLDVFSREFYNVTQSSYIQDPTVMIADARQRLLFTGVCFGVSPVAIGNGTTSLSPLSVQAQIPTTWNQSAYRPAWMYWSTDSQTWERLAPVCGPAQTDTVTNLSLPSANISAPICDPYNPVLPDCPNTTQSCQTVGAMAPEGTVCRFPFNYNGTVYTACTTRDSPTGQAWCGTAASVTGDGDWGHCNCFNASYCVTRGMMAPRGSQCVFPFTANGQTHSKCVAGMARTSWCATESSLADGAWGLCSCFNVSFDNSTCLPTGSPRPDPAGPSRSVQIALMLVATDTSCAAPLVPDIHSGQFPQGFARDIVVRLNSTLPFGDPITYVLATTPTHGTLDTTRLTSSGIVKYLLSPESQFYYGNETFRYTSQQTGLTLQGRISPCVPLQSNIGTVVITITNLNDAPQMVLDVFAQPNTLLRDKYGANDDARFVFEISIPEDTTFSANILVQDHDIEDTFDFLLLQAPQPSPTPAWVQLFAANFTTGGLAYSIADRHPWSEYGTETLLSLTYTPSENLNGVDRARFTVRDVPGPGMASLLANNAPFEVRVTLLPVNDVPVALPDNFFVDSATARQGLPYFGLLRYYDIETPTANLTLRFPTRFSFFDQYNLTAIPDNETYSVLTSRGGRVTLLPTNETGNLVWVRFRYMPPASGYSEQDSFTYLVTDGNATSLAAVVSISYPQASSGGLAPAVAAAIAILVVLALVTVLVLAVVQRRRARQRKVSFLKNVQAVESDRVIHATEFPLWVGPMDALDFASEATAQHDMYVPRPAVESEPVVLAGPTKTMLKTGKHVDLGEDRGELLVMPAQAERPAHTTYTDARMGFAADSLLEIENPLYVSDRALGDWSQRHAYEGVPSREFRAVVGLGRTFAAPAGTGAGAAGAGSAASPLSPSATPNPNAPGGKSNGVFDESRL